MSIPTLLKTLLAALVSFTFVCFSTPVFAQHGGGHAGGGGGGFHGVERGSPAVAITVAPTTEARTAAEPTGAVITAARAEVGITPDQVLTAVAAPTEACAAAHPPCAALTILGLQRATQFGIPLPDGIPSNDRPTVAPFPHTLEQQPLAGRSRKLAQVTTRQRLTRPWLTDNGTASEPRIQPQLWRQTVP
jgi:hypothetical protein